MITSTTTDAPQPPAHVNYPHRPGRLYDCPACEAGPCTCKPRVDAPCVSVNCVQMAGGGDLS